MQGKRRTLQHHRYGKQQSSNVGGDEIIKKGPWKREEDEVLLDHVERYGPRDWSSLRSNGLLRRTGKSCRLRWVNKLRPDLKTGTRFTEEEGQVIVDLQAKFGNKWAKIATYLTGRTDNDVKNFWSSRKKRLARISKSSKQKDIEEPLFTGDYPSLEAPKFISNSSAEDEFVNLPVKNSQSFSSGAVKDGISPNGLCCYDDACCNQLRLFQETEPVSENGEEHNLFFPRIPEFPPKLFDGPDFLAGLGGDSSLFLDGFGKPSGSFGSTGPDADVAYNGTMNLGSFLDDLPPLNAFDPINPLLPGPPPKWA